MQLSKYLKSEHFEYSDKAKKNAILNKMPTNLVASASIFGTEVYDKLVELFKPNKIIFHSGYRSKELNVLVKGQPTSQHMKANALDFHVDSITIQEAYDKIVASDIIFDQLVIEHDRYNNVWLHI